MINSVKGMKVENSDMVINYETFDYLSEIVKSNRERPHRHNHNRFTSDMDSSWDGVDSYEEAEELAIHGWKAQEGNKDFNQVFNFKPTAEEEKMVTFKNDIVGYVPIIPLVLQGIPTSMVNVTKKRVKSRIIHIVYNISTTCGTSSKRILQAGLELFKVIVKLERQGYRVRLTALQDFSGESGDGKSSDFMILNLKSEYKPLDISTTMFPLLHTAMFRVLGFAWFERSPVSIQRSGYGTSFERVSNKQTMLQALNQILKTDAIKYIWFDDIDGKDCNQIIKMLNI